MASYIGSSGRELITSLGELGRPFWIVDHIEHRLVASSGEELATWCGSSREATAKALRTLREIGAIETARRTVTITDEGELRRQAHLA